MVVLAQGPGPFVSRRDAVIKSTISKIEAVNSIGFSQTSFEIQGRLSTAVTRPIERFDFSSSLFFNFSEENLLSLEGPPAADALFVLSAWIQ